MAGQPVARAAIRPVDTVKLRLVIKGKEVLFDTNEQLGGAIGMMAKMETERSLTRLIGMLEQADAPQERIERILRKLINDPRADLALVDILADVTAEHARMLREPYAVD